MMKVIIVGFVLLCVGTTLSDYPAVPHPIPLSVTKPQNHKVKHSVHVDPVDCLASNMYFEARGQSTTGQVAVAFVTLNRVSSGKFPNTVCGVVQQQVNNSCQFTWWCDPVLRAKSLQRSFREFDTYKRIRELAASILYNRHQYEDITQGATFFHATHVSPQWRRLEKTVQIEDHIFYKYPTSYRP